MRLVHLSVSLPRYFRELVRVSSHLPVEPADGEETGYAATPDLMHSPDHPATAWMPIMFPLLWEVRDCSLLPASFPDGHMISACQLIAIQSHSRVKNLLVGCNLQFVRSPGGRWMGAKTRSGLLSQRSNFAKGNARLQWWKFVTIGSSNTCVAEL